MALHPQNEEWVRRALDLLGSTPRLVVEVGSKILHPHDPHDSRPVVRAERFVGVDANPGPGVDVVSLGHEFDPEEEVDLVLSLVALEHDPHWPETLRAAAGWLRPGGVLCIVCAGPGCREHEHDESPEPGHYGNVSSVEIVSVLDEVGLRSVIGDVDTIMGDQPGTRTRVLGIRS